MSRILMVGYRAADLVRSVPAGEVTCHVLDIYQQHAIEKSVPQVAVVCSAHLPSGPWDRVMFRTGPKLMSGELSLDLLQEISHLTGGELRPPRFELDFVGRERDRNDLLAKVRDDPKRVRSFRATWPASVPGGERLSFVSYPGCFCHRRQDDGGLALAEVVTRELTAADTQPNGAPGAGLRILDMGCGCGLVGLLIAKRLSPSTSTSTFPPTSTFPSTSTSLSPSTSLLQPHLTLIDSHARAIEAAKENAAAMGVAAEVVMADDGIDRLDGLAHSFDVFVGNPPYYSDYRIADVFLDTARKALRPGGACYTVCKNAAGLEPVQRRYFPAVTIIPRRGYSILKSVSE